jgi:polygalacturonase
MSYFDPLDYGAKADGEKVDTAACQAAIDAAYANGGGTVIFRSGKQVLAGSLILKDNVWIHMEPGSTLKCSGVSVQFLGCLYDP